MNWRNAVVSIIAILVVTWLLISAITLIQPVQGGNGSGGGSLGSGGGSGGGSGTGNGLGNGPGSGFSLNLPNFPINFHFPNLNLKNPLNIPIINFSFPDPFHFKFPPLNISLTGGSKPNPPGGGGSSGTGKSTQTTPVHNNILKIILNPIILAILVIALTAILLVVMLMKREKGKPKVSIKQHIAKKEESIITEEPQIIFEESDDTRGKVILSKVAVPYFSISSIDGLYLPIEKDLPPLWNYKDRMQYEIMDGISMFLNSNHVGDGPQAGEVSLNEGINSVQVKNNENNNEIKILGNVYEEDITDTIRANIGAEILEKEFSSTLRELLQSKKIENKIKDEKRALNMIHTFERALYGKKKISRREYEDFLRDLNNSIRSPLIIWRSEVIAQ